MQLLASMSYCEQWHQILSCCELEEKAKVENLPKNFDELSDSTGFCLTTPLSLDQLSALLAESEIEIVLGWSAPESEIGRCIKEGKSISDAVEEWLQQTSSVLTMKQKYRRKLILVQAESLLINPAGAPTWLSLDIKSVNLPSSLSSCNINDLIAAQMLRQQPEAMSCWQRLIASSLPLVEQSQLSFNLNAIEKQSLNVKEQLDASEEENNLVVSQFMLLQEELELTLREHQDTTADIQEQLDASKTDNSVILQQLRQAHKELEQSLIRNKTLGQQKTLLEVSEKQLQVKSQHEQTKLKHKLKIAMADEVHARHELAATLSELSDVTSSALWRTAKPVRKLKTYLKKKSGINKQLQKNIALISSSDYFNATWYLQSYPDVMQSGVNPAKHYLLFGASENRSPGPMFDGSWYLSEYPDVAKSNTNPLLHYILFGAQEGRTASPKLLQDLTATLDKKSEAEEKIEQNNKAKG